MEERRAEVAEPHERHGPFAVEAEDALELRLQTRDVVADATNAELAEVREVLPHLGGIEVEALGQLL